MMAAAAMGATAFQKALGAIHALSHPVGALYDTHHGLTNAVFMPYVLVFNRKAIEGRIKRLAAYIGLKPSFRAFLDWVLALRAEIGVPHTLAGLQVGDGQVPPMRGVGIGRGSASATAGSMARAMAAARFMALL
jgi:alcohol dehydrogenase